MFLIYFVVVTALIVQRKRTNMGAPDNTGPVGVSGESTIPAQIPVSGNPESITVTESEPEIIATESVPASSDSAVSSVPSAPVISPTTEPVSTVATDESGADMNVRTDDMNYTYDEKQFDMKKVWDLRGDIRIIGEEYIEPTYTQHMNQIADEFSACLYAEYDFIDEPKTIIMLPYKNRAMIEVDVGYENAYFDVKFHEEGGFYLFQPIYNIDPDEIMAYKETFTATEGYPMPQEPQE